MNKQLIIIGASGHGKVCLDIALEMNQWEKIYFIDDNSKDEEVLGYKLIGTREIIQEYKHNSDFFVAIGDNHIRSEILNELIENNFSIATLIHPKATISRFVIIGKGTVIMPGAIINADTSIGIGNIINTNANIDHDCRIGDFNHLSPSSVLLGAVHLDDHNWLGSNSVVKENIKIESNNIIGANSFINHNLKSDAIFIGTPGDKK